jgi:hypothetical protein
VDIGHGGFDFGGDIAGLDLNADVGLDVGHAVADVGHLLGNTLDLGLFDCGCA